MSDSPQKQLRDIQQMIRFGFYRDLSTLPDWSEELNLRIRVLRQHLKRVPDALSPPDKLQFISLQVDFHDILGQDQKALRILDEYLPWDGVDPSPGSDLASMVSGVYAPHFTSDSAETFKQEERWIRQVAWLHMELAWVGRFRQGKFERALGYLDTVFRYLQEHLIYPRSRPPRPSYGTLFQYYYYRGHCERALRRFSDSLDSFTRAQTAARDRYRLKAELLGGDFPQRSVPYSSTDEERMRRLAPDRRFAGICTARILGAGLAWNSTQRGQLAHAQEMCLSAETLLLGTGQAPLREFIRSNRLVAERRSATTPDGARIAMRDLARCFNNYRKVGDPLGQLRCGIEFVRGHLDYLIYWQSETTVAAADAQANSARVVQNWIRRLRNVAAEVTDPSWGFRIDAQAVRLALLATKALPMEQRAPILRDLGAQTERASDHLAPGAHDVELQILRSEIAVCSGDYRAGMAILDAALRRAQHDDPVLEAECHLHQAEIALKNRGLQTGGGSPAALAFRLSFH